MVVRTRDEAGSGDLAPPGTTVLGIDEDTALVSPSGDGRRWQVQGRQQAWLLDGGSGRPFPAGAIIDT